MKEKEKVLGEYLDYKRITAHTEKKINNYKYFVGMFLNSINRPLKDVSEKDVIDFINIIGKKYSVGSMNEIKIMLKSFLYWYYVDHPIRFRNLKKICAGQRKEKTYSPEQMLTQEDIQKLVQGENDPRWKTFFLLLFYGGFRPGEVCNLEWKNILFDKEGAYIKVYVKKNGKTFEKFIPEDVCFYLKKLQQNNSRYVFPTRRTNKHGIPNGDIPQTTSGVYQHLIPLAKRVLGKPVNPYILRHSIATILYNRDDLKEDDVAQQMGHTKEMKQTYSNLSLDKIRERMKKIYIKAEELPPEKKKEMEERIEEQDKKIEELTLYLTKTTEIFFKQFGVNRDNPEKEDLNNENYQRLVKLTQSGKVNT